MAMLEQIFQGVAVDGTTAYVPGQASRHDDEEDYEDNDEVQEVFQEDSPNTSGSQKRSSSSRTTATSPRKKSKSPIVRIFSQFLAMNKKQSDERTQFLQQQAALEAEEKRRKEAKKQGDLDHLKQLALEAGVRKGGVEWYALGYLCKDEAMTNLFMDCETEQARVEFLRRFCRDYNLD